MIAAGEIPIVLLVKNNSVLPHVKPAQSTAEIDWNDVELRVFGTGNFDRLGAICIARRRCPRDSTEAVRQMGSYFQASFRKERSDLRYVNNRSE